MSDSINIDSKFKIGEKIMYSHRVNHPTSKEDPEGKNRMFTYGNIYVVKSLMLTNKGKAFVQVEKTDNGKPGSHLEYRFSKAC